jgi:hypothetical protein
MNGKEEDFFEVKIWTGHGIGLWPR